MVINAGSSLANPRERAQHWDLNPEAPNNAQTQQYHTFDPTICIKLVRSVQVSHCPGWPSITTTAVAVALAPTQSKSETGMLTNKIIFVQLFRCSAALPT
jgi:hypothetical protein